MRSSDIVMQLMNVLPTLCDDFTTQYNITTLTHNVGVATATCDAPHNLQPSNVVSINGAFTPIPISSVTVNGVVSEIVTTADHDLTEFNVENAELDNGSFKLERVLNRRTIVVIGDATNATLLVNGSSMYQSYNGLHNIVATPSPNVFTYNTGTASLLDAMGDDIQAKTRPRISSGAEIETLLKSYTKHSPDNAWLFVVLGDSTADRRRANTENIQPGEQFDQRLVQQVSVYVSIPCSHHIAGRASRDRAEELLVPISRSLLAYRPPSLLQGADNPLMIVSHGMYAYNGAVYVHEYIFECVIQMGLDDIFIERDDVAFRDISMDMNLDNFDTEIDLDDEPLV